MAKNRIFFPLEALDAWVQAGHVDLTGEELSMKGEGRRYRITEAVRVLREVTGLPDGFDLVGKVKSRAYLHELEAEIFENSMLVGDNAYDVLQGFVGLPIGTFADHLKTAAGSIRPPSMKAPGTDEELLGQFLLRVL